MIILLEAVGNEMERKEKNMPVNQNQDLSPLRTNNGSL